MSWRFWIDRGGTFTDVIGCAPDGVLHTAKLLSNDPARDEDAVIAGIRRMLGAEADATLPLARIGELRVGTTVATNALLERKGAKTLFVTNAGLGDLLVIGDQSRPEIFVLDIKRTPPLYARVATTALRLGIDGNERAPLNEAALRDEMEAARASGCASCAIALMHAWRYPEQEARVAKLAHTAGFERVVTSHEVSPLMRLVPRAATTVVEAYLAPVVGHYTSRLAAELPGVPLAFMKSDGGLASADSFAARDALLSGPAGGVIGAVETARRAGFEQVIGFDMGGTSTDVCHYAGAWERKRETTIAGVPLSRPMLAVETVAAGGGSIVAFDEDRLTVGPASAGADPGPACYRKGGPLTVTDCNLLLGRIAAAHFPRLFGPNGNQPLDEEVVRTKFAALGERMVQTPEQVAAGALAIAVEHMIAAIRRISIARGHDPVDCVLNVFGGAGGQHACAVADALGIETALLHPLAGVLSALGIGLTECSVLLERGLEAELPEAYSEAASAARELEAEARERLTEEAPDAGEIHCSVTALVRYAGSESSLPVDFGSADELAERFNEAHRAHFQFVLPERAIVVAALRVEARAKSEAPQWAEASAGNMPEPLEYRQVYFGDGWEEAPFYRRCDLPSGATLEGPAVLIEPTSTTIVEPGWRGEIGSEGELVLQKTPSPRWGEGHGEGAERDVTEEGHFHPHPNPLPERGREQEEQHDPVVLELMGARFMAIAEEMGEALRASAQSVNVRERLDFSCAVFGPDGALVANAPHIPVHLGAMSATIRALMAAEPMRPGDVWVTNDVYAGGTHLPDITVITPVFAGGPHPSPLPKGEGARGQASSRTVEEGSASTPSPLEEEAASSTPSPLRGEGRGEGTGREAAGGQSSNPIFFVASRAHHADIGGVSPGSMPAASRYIEEEGVLIPFTRLVADGEFREAAIRGILEGASYPARSVERNLADFRAQVAANARGARGLLDLAWAQGLENTHFYMRHLADYAETAVRRALKKLPASGRFEAPLDNGSRIVVAVEVDRDAGTAVFDFTGTSKASGDNFNAPRAVVRAAVLYVLRTLIAEPIPLNDGCLRPVTINVPEGSLLDPPPPHAVVAGNVEVSQVLTDALLAALGKLAASQGTMNNLTFGNARYQHYETLAGGAGAGEGFDGASGVHTHMTNSRLTDPELLEFRFPVALEEFSIRSGTGGAGRWRGGDGVVRRIRFREAMTVTILANRRRTEPFGIEGGAAGACGETRVLRADGAMQMFAYAESVELAPGDAIEIRTPGAGGYGRAD
ncbi:MAG: hydantoinase B/oxoprolinase family protein [Gammaproteobacteria bacterium]|nr:hydantoinase B/oxoprolinase family protein [Gammaproteobacteria bacterium]